MVQQARNVAMFFGEQADKPRFLLRDHDSKFTKQFDEILQAEGVEMKPLGPRAPNMNAVAERWVQSVQQECLDYFMVFGEAHLRHLLTEYLVWYHQCRPHQALGNRPLQGEDPVPAAAPMVAKDVVCEERPGGLLKQPE
jgi:transposase InsO family protein